MSMTKNDKSQSPADLTVGLMYFSPTGTTRKIIEKIAASISSASPIRMDLTIPNNYDNKVFDDVDLWVVGSPVYASRLPLIANKRLSDALGGLTNKTSAVAVSVYGDVEVGIALKQLVNLISEKGFKVIGAGEFIGEHFFKEYHGMDAKSTIGRPDERDLAVAKEFGLAVRQKGLSGSDISSLESIQSAKIPFKLKFTKEKRVLNLLGTSAAESDKCTKCQACVNACPMGCIDNETLMSVNSLEKYCIGCGNCWRICPNEARSQTFRMKWLAKIIGAPKKKRGSPVYYT